MKRSRWPWLVAAGLLLLAAAWLFAFEEDSATLIEAQKIELPKRMETADWKRAEVRRSAPSLVQLSPPALDAGPPPPSSYKPRDPLLAAMPREMKKGLLVFEANAVRHSPIGEPLLDCMFGKNRNTLTKFHERTGIDLANDMDRIAMIDDSVVLTGDFKNQKLQEELGPSYAYGKEARVYPRQALPDGGRGSGPAATAVWRDELIAMGDSEAEVKALIDRLESGEGGGLSEGETYGELYGRVSPEFVGKMFEDENPALAEKFRQAAKDIRLHLDASGDVGLVLDVAGGSSDTVDLGKSLGAAMSIARLDALARGKTTDAELLELARVRPGEDSFRMEVALPQAFVEQKLAECVARREARRDAGLVEEHHDDE